MVQQKVALQQYYSRIYAQAFSSKYGILALGCSEGNLAIIDGDSLTNSRSRNGKVSTVSNVHNDAIHAMTSTPDFCVTSATGVLSGWNWKHLQNADPKPSWKIPIDFDHANFGTPEINSLAFDSEQNFIFAACGDWKTRSFDLETGKQIAAFEGHENYVHDVVVWGNQIGTAGEDGKVLIWDMRAGKEPKIKLIPSTIPQIERPHIGNFITSIDIEKEWLVCAGGPTTGVFHLRSLALATTLPSADSVINVSRFCRQGSQRGDIAIAGVMQKLLVFNISGDVTAEIPTSSSCIYSLSITNEPFKFMTIGGSGPFLDVCLNLNYRDHTISIFDT